MELETTSPVSAAERSAAEGRHVTLQPLHSDIRPLEVEALSSDVITKWSNEQFSFDEESSSVAADTLRAVTQQPSDHTLALRYAIVVSAVFTTGIIASVILL